MANVPLTIPPGFYQNGTDYDAAGRWRDGNFIRFFRGEIQPIGGWANISLMMASTFPTPVHLSGTGRKIEAWRDLSQKRWFAIGTTTSLYAHDGGTLFDITPVTDPIGAGQENSGFGTGYGAGPYDTDTYDTPRTVSSIVLEAGTWAMDTWGEELVCMATWDGRLMKWPPGDAEAVLINATPGQSEVPEKCRYMLVSNERHMIAIGAGSWSGSAWDEDHRRIAWSDAEDYATWTPALTNAAGDLYLQTNGIAQCGAKFRNEILIWTEMDMHRMTYIGHPYYYGIHRLSESAGILGPDAFVSTSNFVFWVGQDGFYIYDGAIRELVPDVDDTYKDELNLAQASKVRCGHNPKFNEIWIFYPSGADECNRYIIWNYEENHWVTGNIERTAWDQAKVWNRPIGSEPKRLTSSHVATDESITATALDTWYRINATYSDEQIKETSVVVTTDPAGTTYVEDTDYEVNYRHGLIRFLSTGSISAAENLLIDYEVLPGFYSILFHHEEGYNAGSASRNVWLESAPIEIAQGDQLAVVRRIWQDTDKLNATIPPDVVEASFTHRLAPEATERTEGPYTLDLTRGYTDVRFTGRQLEIKVTQLQDVMWRLGKWRLEMVAGSGR